MIRTRFAPSPTGYLHIGGARTALFAWAYARRQGGKFFLRIEDTDLERSTEASVQTILDSMEWLGLDSDRDFHSADGEPMRQMQRLARYREAADQLVRAGRAYPCYASRDELDVMREAQRTRGEKPRYDGRWRPENARGKTPPADVQPVIRFRNPDDGVVGWSDLVKGPIEIANAELDDLVILRADGVPTYNFGVVVDDLDMQITHVIRGDDHVNNTPRQINIYDALGASMPRFAHVPMILGADGERLSKRHGSVSVMQYREEGYLADALTNFLARLGWSHGDEEIFSREQFVEWFDLAHVSRSPAQFNPEKLAWLNGQYIKAAAPETLAAEVAEHIATDGGKVAGGPPLAEVIVLMKDRASTLAELADGAMLFYGDVHPSEEMLAQHLTAESRPALIELANAFEGLTEWREDAIGTAFGGVLKAFNLKMPKLAMPVRAVVFGQTQTPSLYPVLALAGRERVVGRLRRYAG
jgi:glutamyl-tRNA synthetase